MGSNLTAVLLLGPRASGVLLETKRNLAPHMAAVLFLGVRAMRQSCDFIFTFNLAVSFYARSHA